MQFNEIIGQEDIKNQLRQMVQEGRIPHAQLFSGPRGVGKMQLAIAFVQYLACEHPENGDACGKCASCLQYKKLQHPDFHFVFPIVKTETQDVCDHFMQKFHEMVLERGYFDIDDWYEKMEVTSKQGLIYEKESSEILRKLSLKPYGKGYKTMIIWLPEKMNAVCANKLLKILEEPPEKTLFILVSENPNALLPTILSRVQQIRIPRLSEQEIAKALRDRDNDLTVDQSLNIAHISNGSFLSALKILNNAEAENAYFEQFCTLMRQAWQVGHKKDYEALSKLREWSDDMAGSFGREKQKNFLEYAQRMIRESFIRNFQIAEINYMTQPEFDFTTNFARFINPDNVEQIMSELESAQQQIEQNGNAKIIFFDLCLHIIMLLK